MNQPVAMQHHVEEMCRLKLWDKDQVSAATNNLRLSIRQPPNSIEANTSCCRSLGRCQSESSSQDGYASSDGGGDSPWSNEQQLHYPSHAHMDPGDVLLLLPGSVTQLENIIRNCEMTSGPDYKEMILQAFSDNSDSLSRFFYELDIISIDPSERTEELIKMLKIKTRVLCLMQEQLCEESRPFKELKIGYFALFAKCPIKKLLEIALCLSKTVWSATHICGMLLAYEALTDVLPFIQKFPSSESGDLFSNIQCNMREAFRGLTDRIKDHMWSNMRKHQEDVAFHPMTCFLICSVRYFSSHSNMLQSTLGPSENSNSFGHLLCEVITCWESMLTEHSKIRCTNLLWQYIFLLNNTGHFNRKTDGLLDELLSDSQIIEHNDTFKSLSENWIEKYTEEACSPAKSCLTRKYWWGSPRPSLVAFASKFNKTFDCQRTWKVPDTALRGELQRRIQGRLLPDYTRSVEECSSSRLFCSVLQIGSTRDIYTPESLETTVQGLYEG